jgi:hypothetical protein
VRPWPGTLQACRVRSCAMGAGAFYSTREAPPAFAARFAMQLPVCHLQVKHLSFGFAQLKSRNANNGAGKKRMEFRFLSMAL